MFRIILVNIILILCVYTAHAKQPVMLDAMGTNENTSIITEITFSPDGKLIASTDDLILQIYIWDVEKRKAISAFKATKEILPLGIKFHPKGDLLAFCNSKNDDIVFLNVKTNKIEKTIDTKYTHGAFAFSPDGKTLACMGISREEYTSGFIHPETEDQRFNVIDLWDVERGEKIKSFKGKINYGVSLQFSPDGNELITGSQVMRYINVINVSTGKENWIADPPMVVLHRAILSPNGKYIASTGTGEMVKIYERLTGKEIAHCSGIGNIYKIEFSPDSKILASIHFNEQDKTTNLWDVSSGDNLASFSADEKITMCMSFSPDGNILATGGTDKKIKLWDVKPFKKDK
jgi:WD40 repeat protein